MKTTELDEKTIASLDRKIKKLQDKVCQKHAEYNALTEELKLLLDERYPEKSIDRKKEALYQAYVDSGKTLDDCIELIMDPDILGYL